MADLTRLAHLLGIDVRHCELPCPVMADGDVVFVAAADDREAMAKGIALVLMARGQRQHTTRDAARLARCLAGY
jgi:hypothetical protein